LLEISSFPYTCPSDGIIQHQTFAYKDGGSRLFINGHDVSYQAHSNYYEAQTDHFPVKKGDIITINTFYTNFPNGGYFEVYFIPYK